MPTSPVLSRAASRSNGSSASAAAHVRVMVAAAVVRVMTASDPSAWRTVTSMSPSSAGT
jgi:hypothetical protein